MDLSNENVVHIKDNGIEYIQFKKLLEFNNLINCFTLRTNGLDFSRSMDNRQLEENYNKICKSLKIDRNSIIRPHQSHTDIIKNVEKVGKEYNDVDGLITNKSNINLMLTFGDCTPILIYDPIKKVVGNIHSGWRGTVQKIGQKAVFKMINDYGSKAEDLIICIGPCIGKCHFEVSKDVKEIFFKTFEYLGRNYDIIKNAEENNKYFIDTTLINRLILEEIGVKDKNIIESGLCTVCNKEYMHSYRADGKSSGRSVSVIGIK